MNTSTSANRDNGVGYPHLDIDPFTIDFIDNPYPSHEQMREAAPVVWLPKYRVSAIARYAEVKVALSNWETFSSARGVGIVDYAKSERFRPKSIILEADPPQHTRSRTALMKALSPRVMKELREGFTLEAERLVDELLQRRTFDGVKDLAEVFPLTVFPDALGMKREGRENLIPVGSLIFNSFGPENELFLASKPLADEGFKWLQMQSRRENLSPTGFGKSVYDQADAGLLTEEEAGILVRAMLMAGVDTTVSGIGGALYCFATFPRQWDALRERPQGLRMAFEEAVRYLSPVQTFFRTVTKDTQLGGFPLAEGSKVLMMLGSANRDPRRWADPNVFDISRDAVGHVGFGGGIHMCVGQNLARLEAEVVLSALLSKVKAIRLTGKAEIRHNNTLRSFAHLPMEIIPA